MLPVIVCGSSVSVCDSSFVFWVRLWLVCDPSVVVCDSPVVLVMTVQKQPIFHFNIFLGFYLWASLISGENKTIMKSKFVF